MPKVRVGGVNVALHGGRDATKLINALLTALYPAKAHVNQSVLP